MTDAAIAAAYDALSAEYIAVAGSIDQMEASDRSSIAAWRDATKGRLLDAGCGPGLWTQFLHDGHRDVVGVDLSEEFLAAAGERYPHLEFLCGSLRALPFESASFGGALAWYSLIHTPPEHMAAVCEELARVLVPGGSLLIGFFDGESRMTFSHAVAPGYFWDGEALGGILRSVGFDVVAQERRERIPGEASRRPHGSVTAIRR
ncbi:class I SAM-dependent methyltransferase [Microbacterium tumbae]